MRALKKSLTLLQNVGGYETSKLSMFALYRRWPKLSIITGVGALIQARNIDFSTFSGKRVETTELYSNGSATSGSITVSDYSGYDYMYFLISRNTNAGWATGIIKVSDFKNGKQYSFLSVTPDNTSRVFSIYGIALQYESDTKIKITKNCDIAFNASGIAGGPTTGGSLSVNKIIGIKLL